MDLENTQGEPILGTIDQVPLGIDPSTDDVPFLASPLPAYGTPVIETLLFFLSAVGCTIGCTAVLSNLVFYSDTLGLDSFLFLNVAVFAPMLPVTLAQALWDAKFDRRFQSLKSFLFRGTVGFFVTLLCLLLLPWASQSLVHLTVTSVFLGLSSAVLHGMLKQMASFVYPHCGRSSASVNAGMQASGLLVLAVSLTYGFGGCTSKEGLNWFYNTIAAMLIVCWCCFQALLMCSHGVAQSMQRRDAI
jgi:MFS family permease